MQQSYYLKMRESHERSLVLGIPNMGQLVKLRKAEIARLLRYWNKGNQSHRTIVAMSEYSLIYKSHPVFC